MARPEGFEPPTAGFEDQNSSTELRTEWQAHLESNQERRNQNPL